MSDIRLGVELVLSVDAAGDLAFSDRLNDGWHALEEVVLLLLGLDTLIEPGGGPTQPLLERLPGSE